MVTAPAQSALVIELRDGSNATFLLAENPRVTFSGEQLSIVSSSAAMEFNRSDVKNWHFADTPSSVENITAEAKAKLEGGALLISGITDDRTITLYSVVPGTTVWEQWDGNRPADLIWNEDGKFGKKH